MALPALAPASNVVPMRGGVAPPVISALEAENERLKAQLAGNAAV